MPLNNQERRRLVPHDTKLGAGINELISIVSYSTFRRRVRNMEEIFEKRPAVTTNIVPTQVKR